MIHLNVGNLWDMDFLDTIIQWNEEFKDSIKVASLFGSISGLTPTARSSDRIPHLEWTKMDEYIYKAEISGIAVRYTLNQSCIGAIQDFKNSWDALKGHVKALHRVGVNEWTVTSPLLIELLRDLFPDDFIEVSTIAEVATAKDTLRWEAIGANGVNASTNIIRDFPAIRTMVNTGIQISLLANEACLYRCPWRRECYNLSSHDSWRGVKFFDFYPFRKCNDLRIENPAEWVISRMILPQWTKIYQQETGVNWFKVTCRTHPKEVALPIIRAYMEQAYTGNLLKLWPTIAALGGTIEPQKQTYISCEALDKMNFLKKFIDAGGTCSYLRCGQDCTYCHGAYLSAKQ